MSVPVPEMTHNNGTVHAVVFVHKSGVLPWKDSRHVRLVARLTSQMVPLQSGKREVLWPIINASTQFNHYLYCIQASLKHFKSSGHNQFRSILVAAYWHSIAQVKKKYTLKRILITEIMYLSKCI